MCAVACFGLPSCMAHPYLAWAGALSDLSTHAPQKLNNASYSNRINNDRWTPQETELFFRVSC